MVVDTMLKRDSEINSCVRRFAKFEMWPSALLRDNQKTRIIWGKIRLFLWPTNVEGIKWNRQTSLFKGVCFFLPVWFNTEPTVYGSRWNLFVVSINGRESAREPHRKEETHNLLKIVQILSHSLVTETIIFPPYKTFYFKRFVSNIQCRWFQAWVTCGETICLRKNTDIFLSLNCLYIFFLCWTFIVG